MDSKPRGNSSESRGNSNLKLRIRIRRGPRIRANSGRIRIRANSCEFEPASLPALRVAGRPVRVSLTLARWYAIPRGLCVPRPRSGCPSGNPRVPFACVCARAPAASAPPPLGGVACAPRAVPALGAGRAVPCGPCPSACPAPVPCSVWRAWGGAVRSRFPPTWLGAVVARGV